MRIRSGLWLSFVLLFFGLSYLYFKYDFVLENHALFLSLSTFLFAIFSGFFISRQSRRYSQLRDQISQFDGGVSAMYRYAGVFGDKFQKDLSSIIKKHYNSILKNRAWDYALTHKTTTITDIQNLFGKMARDKKFNSMKGSALGSIFRSFAYMQIARKKMDIMHQERIPVLQWGLLVFLAGILLVSVSAIGSVGLVVPAILKGAFGTSIILVLVILYQFNNLSFFENTIGEHSAQDVLDIMGGKR